MKKNFHSSRESIFEKLVKKNWYIDFGRWTKKKLSSLGLLTNGGGGNHEYVNISSGVPGTQQHNHSTIVSMFAVIAFDTRLECQHHTKIDWNKCPGAFERKYSLHTHTAALAINTNWLHHHHYYSDCNSDFQIRSPPPTSLMNQPNWSHR